MKPRGKAKRKKFVGRNNALSVQKSQQKSKIILFSLAWFLACGILGWSILFVSGAITMGGVPAGIVFKFLGDRTALTSFFQGHTTELHNRLESLGIEEEIKTYYRPQIPDEAQLDQYIHQLLYNWTGYVGSDYFVTSQKILVLKTRKH